jgi:hypothetical protein
VSHPTRPYQLLRLLATGGEPALGEQEIEPLPFGHDFHAENGTKSKDQLPLE